MQDQLTAFFKTLCDAKRIRMAALLLDEDLSIDQLAERLGLRAVEVPRHLAQFEKLGLLRVQAGRYRLDLRSIEAFSRSVLANSRPAAKAHSNDQDADDFERSVVMNYSLPDGRLKEIPAQEKKLRAILKHVITVFDPGKAYDEKQVNEALNRFHPDTATLRRALVDRRMIERERNGSSYWRPAG